MYSQESYLSIVRLVIIAFSLLGEARRSSLVIDNRSNNISGLRLQPNWNSESKLQSIRISFTLDDIDKANMSHIANNYTHIKIYLRSILI